MRRKWCVSNMMSAMSPESSGEGVLQNKSCSGVTRAKDRKAGLLASLGSHLAIISTHVCP